ncbi:MAG: dephospho-CoA kinase [Kiritimatiellae bacterium]|nr:dephospho-CoA kinase [Kiritimatiellia bacterium]
MPHIALTGGIACGKSLAAKMLNDLGVETLDADDIVHELLPDPAERRRIAAEVFTDPAKRRALERRLHPQVRARLFAWLDAPRADSAPPRVAVVPLLYEAGWEGDFDLVGCVASAREAQLERMIAARGYSREEALGRLAAQLPVEDKAARADFVIRNDGSVDDLRAGVRAFAETIREFNTRGEKNDIIRDMLKGAE